MPDFDIEHLIDFHPPRSWCGKCFALSKEHRIGISPGDGFLVDTSFKFVKCKVCNVRYIPTEDYGIFQVGKYIDMGIDPPLCKISNILDHSRQLAEIAKHMRVQAYKPFRSLIHALIRARSFVHFTSYGITQLIIGILKMAAQHVAIRGVVSGPVSEQIISEVTDYRDDAPALSIIFCESKGLRTIDIPHQKLVVIDGLLAFKGSANLTQMAWRSAEQDMDIIEAVSKVDEVTNLHNRFFSPIWGKLSDIGDEIEMSNASPLWLL